MKSPFVGKVLSTERITASKSPYYTRHIILDCAGSAMEGKVRAGQSIGVIPPGTDPRTGKPAILRLYSTASPSFGEDGQGRHYALCVKRVIDENWNDGSLFLGYCSNYACDLPAGAEVRLTGPSGKHFVLPEDPAKHNHVFIATGTGIAPFRGMMMDLERSGFTGKTALYFGVPYSTDVLYDRLFKDYEKKMGLRYRVAVSREQFAKDGKRKYVDAVLAEDEAAKELLADPRTIVYICGLKGMEDGLFSIFHSWNTGLLDLPPGFDPAHPADPKNPWKGVKPNRERLLVEVY